MPVMPFRTYCEYVVIAQLVLSRESDLHSVPYNRPVGIRSFVKNATNRIQCRPLCRSQEP